MVTAYAKDPLRKVRNDAVSNVACACLELTSR